MSDSETIVRARGLDLGYGERRVLHAVDLEVRRGEMWFFIGPNGTGKTTLLRAILGSLEPVAGELWLDPRLAGRERQGYVPQILELNPTLPTTVREFASLGFVGSRVPRRERAAALQKALHSVGLDGREQASLRALSGGQRQRALGARALDVAAADAFRDTVSELNRRDGLTLIFVTHNLLLASRLATHVALFHDGHVRTGRAETLLHHDVLERAFGISVDVATAREAL